MQRIIWLQLVLASKILFPLLPFFAGSELQLQDTMLSYISRAVTFFLVTGSILNLLHVPASSSGSVLHLESDSLNRTRRSSSLPSCYRDIEVMAVPYKGCESGNMIIDVCKGSCGSNSIHSLIQPYKERICNCCRAVEYKIKVKKIMLRCGPRLEFEEKKVYYPKLVKGRGKGCGCTVCGSNVL